MYIGGNNKQAKMNNCVVRLAYLCLNSKKLNENTDSNKDTTEQTTIYKLSGAFIASKSFKT